MSGWPISNALSPEEIDTAYRWMLAMRMGSTPDTASRLWKIRKG